MMLALKFLLAVAALILPGEALLRWLAPGFRWGWCRPLVAFGIGQGVATWCLWCLGMAGVPMWTWGMAMVIAGSAGILVLNYVKAYRTGGMATGFAIVLRIPAVLERRRLVGQALPWLILITAAWVLTVHAAEAALAHRIGCVPGMGNWAIKTKLLLMAESWPTDFFEYEAYNRRLGYPPGRSRGAAGTWWARWSRF